MLEVIETTETNVTEPHHQTQSFKNCTNRSPINTRGFTAVNEYTVGLFAAKHFIFVLKFHTPEYA